MSQSTLKKGGSTLKKGGFLIFYMDMINEETPYKLAEIIRDTWPGLYRLLKERYNENSTNHENEKRIQPHTETRKEN